MGFVHRVHAIVGIGIQSGKVVVIEPGEGSRIVRASGDPVTLLVWVHDDALLFCGRVGLH
jgi:hypothetical protein